MRDERGQALVLAVLVLTALIGMSALVVDVGSWFQASRHAQAVADAAALAGAQELPIDPSAAVGEAVAFADKNGAALAAANVTVTTRVRPNDAIVVRASDTAPSILARLLGVGDVAVGATAVASAAPLAAARWAAPIAVNEQHPLLQCQPNPCFGQSTTLTLADLKGSTASGAGAFGLIDYDGTASGASGASRLADWLLRGYGSTLGPGSYASDPGAKFNSSEFRSALQARVGSELLLPVYRSLAGTGSNAVFAIVAWVGFRLTGYSGSGSSGSLVGTFERVTWSGDPAATTSQPDYGARAVALVR